MTKKQLKEIKKSDSYIYYKSIKAQRKVSIANEWWQCHGLKDDEVSMTGWIEYGPNKYYLENGWVVDAIIVDDSYEVDANGYPVY